MKKKIEIRIAGCLTALVIFCFAVYMIAVYDKVNLSYDDYGYFCLSYPIQTPEYSSRNYSFWDLIRYATGTHYQTAQGRMSFLILGLGINCIAGLSALRLTFALSVVLICFWSAWQVKRNNSWVLLCAVWLASIFYGMLAPVIHQVGTYWLVAAWYYLLPIPFFLMLYSLLDADMPVVRKSLFAGILTVMLGNAIEQIFVLTFVFCAIHLIVDWTNRKSIISDVVALVGSMIGACGLLCSPAAWARLNRSESLGIVRRLLVSGEKVINVLFSTRNFWYLLVFLLCQGMLALLLMLCGRKRIGLDILHLVGSGLMLAKLAFSRVKYGEWGIVSDNQGWLAACIFAYWFLCMVQMIRWHLQENTDRRRPMLTFAAYASIGCMAIFPELSERAYIPFILFSFVDMLDIYISSFFRIKKKVFLISFVFMLAGLSVISIRNMHRCYRNMYRNDVVFDHNDTIMETADESKDTIHLYAVPFPEYTIQMNNEFEQTLIRYYYGLDADREFIYDMDPWMIIQ